MSDLYNKNYSNEDEWTPDELDEEDEEEWQ